MSILEKLSFVKGKDRWQSTSFEPFAGETGRKRAALCRFIDQQYGNIIDRIAEQAGCDDGVIDPSSTSLAFKGIMTNDEQHAMFQSIADGQPINNEQRVKIRDAFVDAIINAGLEKEIENDCFLRKRHVNEIIYRNGIDPKTVGKEFVYLLWGVDDGFYSSGELHNALASDDFLENRWKFSEATHESAEQAVEKGAFASAEDAKAHYRRALVNIVNWGVASPAELVKDPFLRERRFRMKYELEMGYLPGSNDLITLWEADSGWMDSFTYGALLDEYADDNPDTYKNVDEAEVYATVDEALEKISDMQLLGVMRAYESNLREGDAALANVLAPVLGLSANPPRLRYRQRGEGAKKGSYVRGIHTIYVYENSPNTETAESGGHEEILGAKADDDAWAHRAGYVLGHEYWHAHQWAGDNIPADKQEKYRKNFVYYFGEKSMRDKYRAQLIEKEAFAFGEKLKARFVELAEKGSTT